MLTPLLCNIAVTGLAGTEGTNVNNKKQGRLTVTLPLACCLLNIYSVFIGKLRMKKYYFYLYYLCVVPDTNLKLAKKISALQKGVIPF